VKKESEKTKKLKVVVVGAGDMGGRHVEGWRNSGRAEVIGIAEANKERLDAFRKKYDIGEGDSDYKKLIEKLKPDVVSVCVPAFLHMPVTVFAANAGCHVFCEKPIALNAGDARTMIDCCRKNNVLLCIDFQRRYWGHTRSYGKLIEDGILEKPILWRLLDLRSIRPKILMHDKNGNGGPIIDCAVHWFDLWRHLFKSEPVSVFARGFCFAEGKEKLKMIKDKALDTGAIIVEYASGDVGELTVCWGQPEGTPDLEDEMLIARNAVAKRNGPMITIHKGKWRMEESVKLDDWNSLISAFAEAIVQKRSSPVSGDDAIVALKVSLAAIKSIETGEIIHLK
jgi:predicted dehydrogenase